LRTQERSASGRYSLTTHDLITGAALLGVALLVAHLVRETAEERATDAVAERAASPQWSVS